MKNIFQGSLVVYLALLLVYWVFLQFTGLKTSDYNYLYSFLFSLIPLIGGIIGMITSGIWGRFKSSLGRALFYFSLGLFSWGSGSMVWSYYNFVEKIAAPYPSLADLGFVLSVIFWATGAIFLSRASGARLALKKHVTARYVALIVLIVVALLSYYLLVVVARGGVLISEQDVSLKVLLDVVYPLGDVISLTLALVIFGLSFRYFGGYYRLSIVSILLGLGVMYIGDFVFSYTTTVGSFYNGNWGDLVFTFALFLMTFGVLGFATKPKTDELGKTKG
jgi:hypothetical protein